jgi:hypothetical protein
MLPMVRSYSQKGTPVTADSNRWGRYVGHGEAYIGTFKMRLAPSIAGKKS